MNIVTDFEEKIVEVLFPVVSGTIIDFDDHDVFSRNSSLRRLS